jgi:hypothetical protein
MPFTRVDATRRRRISLRGTRSWGGAALVALLMSVGACSGEGEAAPTTTTSTPPPATTSPPTTEPPGERLFVFSLSPGECFDQRVVVEDDEEVPADFAVDCAGLHQNEVFVSVDYPASPGDPYPDDAAWDRYLAEQCFSQVEVFVGTPYELSELEVSHRKPTPESWAAEPDRQVSCWLHLRDGTNVVGSVQGSGR